MSISAGNDQGIDIKNLEPRKLWEKFAAISEIPRPSRKEDAARDYVLSQARTLKLETVQDTTGNLLVRKKGREEKKHVPVTVLQAHLDMVCVAEQGVEHDFTKDPLRLRSDGRFVTASGTSLGADNGIGVAAMLALMEDNTLQTGPLEFLFTVDEETGLTGALEMDPSLLKGRRLLNLDTQKEGVIYVGCSGGINILCELPFSTSPGDPGKIPFSLRVGGLTGGHSGLDIDKGRANALKLLAGLLWEIRSLTDFSLVRLKGGNKSNVIPREAAAVLRISEEKENDFRKTVENFISRKTREFEKTDPDLKIEILTPADSDSGEEILDSTSRDNLLNFLTEAPHGVLAMNNAFPGLVETSVNLATVRMQDGKIIVGMNGRSPADSAMNDIAGSVERIAGRFGMRTRSGGRYPGWRPKLDSPLLQTAKRVYQNNFGKEPKIRATHAGLECGVIGSKFPGMDIISIGCDIFDLHSPSERVEIASVGKFWTFLKALLEAL